MKSIISFSQLVKTALSSHPLTPHSTCDSGHKTQTYCLNKLCPKKVECLKTLHLEL